VLPTLESHEKGDATEAAVVAELKRRAIPVARPFGDNQRYDAVAETSGGDLLKIQIKTGWLADGKVHFHGKSQHTNSTGNVYERYDGDVDYFVVYSDDLDELYLIDESEFETKMALRVDPPKQSDSSINWAEDYRFDANWPPTV
jgi:hypothetical protein